MTVGRRLQREGQAEGEVNHSMTRIAIDAMGITKAGGGRTATMNLLEPLTALDHENEYLIFVDLIEPSLTGHPNVRQYKVGIHSRFLARLWAQLALPVLLRREKIDIMHYARNLGAFLTPGRSVLTIYDMSILLYPEVYPTSDVIYWRTVQRLMVRNVNRIISISEITARDIRRLYHLPAEKVEVIPCAHHSRHRPASPEETRQVRSRYGLPEDFILHVGSISPKKNLPTLVRAFERLKREGYPGALVLVGRVYRSGQDSTLLREIEASEERESIVLLGPVPDQDLPALYSAAQVFAFPSLHEGFGLAPLEAIACGTPVVASRTAAVVEVLGDAGTFVESPQDDQEMARQITRLLSDDDLREEIRARGLERARRYSGEEVARRTLELYRRLVARD